MAAEVKVGVGGKILRVFIALAFLAAGGWAYAYLKSTAPTMKRQRPKPMPTVVEVIKAAPSNTKATITAMGSVIPSKEITLRARVSSEVIEVSPNFTPGGRVKKGEVLLRLDPADYEVEVKRAESSLDKAKADYSIELGFQQVAKDELRLMTEQTKMRVENTQLALRQPQLKQAKADVQSAEASLQRARLNLDRTVIRAPFNALIIDRGVNLGSQVGSQDRLATLVGTDVYWVEAAIPLDKLPKLPNPQNGGAPATVYSHSGNNQWKGRTLRVTGTLNEDSRMAKVIVAVPDPLALTSPDARQPLIIGDYVSVRIQGSDINQAIELPRAALRDNDSVWVLEDNRLKIQKVDLAWKEKERVFVRQGLQNGAMVVVSELAAPIEGMRLVSADQAKNRKRVKPELAPPGQAGSAKSEAQSETGNLKKPTQNREMPDAQGSVPKPVTAQAGS